MGDYVIPWIHLRSYRERPRNQTPQRIYTPSEPEERKEEIKVNPPPLTPPKENQYSYLNIPDKISEEPLETSEKTVRKGISVIIFAVKNHRAVSHLRVECGLYKPGLRLDDENGTPCYFHTSTHNPLVLTDDKKQIFELNKLFLLNGVVNLEGNMMNKAEGMNILFQEEYMFFRNLLLDLKKDKRDIYLLFQIFEKPEPVEINIDNKSVSYKSRDDANYGGGEFKRIAWLCFKVNNENKQIRVGRYKEENTYDKPSDIIFPPDQDKIAYTDIYIDFAIDEFVYDDDMLRRAAKRKKPQ